MVPLNRIFLVGVTVSSALAIGYFMQSAPSADAHYKQAKTVPTVAAPAEVTTQKLELSGVTHTSALPSLPVSEIAILPETQPRPAPETVALADESIAVLPKEEPTATFGCAIDMSTQPKPAAMVSLTLQADCLPNQNVTIHHNGMMISGVSDDAGVLRMLLPALSKQAVYIAAFENGEGAVSQTMVSDFELYDRVLVQWRGQGGFQLHALEFGSGYGGKGHVWSGAARSSGIAEAGNGGFLTILGDRDFAESLRAEVYTFPGGNSGRNGGVDLRVEAEITDLNCGRDVDAQALQVSGGGALSVQDLTLSMPGCDAIGDFLVLKNLLQDLKVARK